MKFSMKGFFSKYDQVHSPVDLVTFTKKVINGKLQFMWSFKYVNHHSISHNLQTLSANNRI